MFESAMGRSEAAYDRFGTGAIISAGAHMLFAAIVFVMPGKTNPEKEPTKDLSIVEFIDRKPPSGGGAPGPAAPAPKPADPSPPKSNKVPIADKPPPEPRPEQPVEPNDEPAANSDGQAGNDSDQPSHGGGTGSGDGTGSGSGGNGPGTGIGQEPEKPTYTELNWTAEMERPVLVAGPASPPYPREAMQLRREATVLAKCRIATDGAVRDCKILKGETFFDEAALGTLAQQRYRPLMYGGRPVSVWYVFRFQFKLK